MNGEGANYILYNNKVYQAKSGEMKYVVVTKTLG